jgi:mRNA-degrading endonuclease RelE of RelBE toxin-antitoxin system
MKWSVSFTRQALGFIKEQKVSVEVSGLIVLAVKKFEKETVSIDIKKLKGEWRDFYRIRKGKWRVIASFDFKNHSVFVEAIDWRGNIY